MAGARRMIHWVFGDDWGVRSIDGYAAPASIENRLNVIKFVAPMAISLSFVSLAAVTLIPLSGGHAAGFHFGGVLAVFVVAILVITPGILFTMRHLPLWGAQICAAVVTGVASADAFIIGRDLSPFITLGYVIVGTGVFVALERRAAVLQLGLIGIGYAVVVAFQEGNSAPVSRWLVVMGAVVIIGRAVAWLVDQVRVLAKREIAAQTKLAELNRALEAQVGEQVDELERLGRLRRFLSTPVVDAVLSSGGSALLEPHRREIAVFFCDLRGFTGFAASSQPEDVLGVLGEYFDLLGRFVQRYEATVGNFTGDGMMAFFNDPLPCEEPAMRAITMAVELQEPVDALLRRWRRLGYDLGFGVGIALGYANIGMIGFEGRRDYTALGSVVNLASRLCAEASSGEILIEGRAFVATEGKVDVTDRGPMQLRGFHHPVEAFRVTGTTGDQTHDAVVIDFPA